MVYGEITLTSPETKITATLPYNLIVSGYVRRSDNGQPLVNAKVDIDLNGKKATVYTDSSGGFSKSFKVTEYGDYYLNIVVTPAEPDVMNSGTYKEVQIWDPTPLPSGNYYWVGLRMLINGVEVEEDHPDIYSGDQVVIDGKLYKDGQPVPDVWISMGLVIGTLPRLHTKTNSNGYFKFVTTAPDWSAYFLCNEKIRYCYFHTEPDESGFPAASWDFGGYARCKEQPNPVFSDAWMEVDEVRYNPGDTIEIEAGTTIYAKAVIVNQGAQGTIYFMVYDAKTGDYVKKVSKTLSKGQSWEPVIVLTPNSDADYELHVAYESLNGDLIVTDEVGCQDMVYFPGRGIFKKKLRQKYSGGEA